MPMKGVRTNVRPASPAHPDVQGHNAPRERVLGGMSAALLAFITTSVCLAPSAVAAPADSLRGALVATRAVSCGPLRSDPLVEQTALAVNETTDKWLDNASRAVPETDAFAVLKDLGYGGSKATILSGAGLTDVNAIKALLLQGYISIPDCSFTDYGVSTLYNERESMYLTTVVLAA